MDTEELEEQSPPPLRLGNYEVVRSRQNLLGRGGFGRVYLGKHIETGDDVAVKEVEITDKTWTFIQRELSYMNTCKHDNIVLLFDTKKTTHSAYIIMEYCQHGNINQFMQKHEMSFEKCTSFMKNMADAVGYLHCDKQICHRDIKPDNVLVSNDLQSSKLADFGLVRVYAGSSSGATGSGVGTDGWLAPEVLPDDEGRSTSSFPADIFSLGLLFLAMLLSLPGKASLVYYKGKSMLCF